MISQGKTKGRNGDVAVGIPMDVTQFGRSSCKLTPRLPLGPGECWFTTPGRGPIHTFGID